jgi:hypothetical protein
VRESHGGLHRHGNLRAEVLQFRRNIVVRHRIPLDFNKDDGVICRKSTFFADGQSALPTSSGLTSPLRRNVTREPKARVKGVWPLALACGELAP